MRTLDLISHTHWDREWHQPFQQFRLKLVHLIDSLLDILDAESLSWECYINTRGGRCMVVLGQPE